MQNATINFVSGLSIGLAISFIAISYTPGLVGVTLSKVQGSAEANRKQTYLGQRAILTHDYMDKRMTFIKPIQPIEFRDSHSHHDDDMMAKELEKRVRVLCWVLTCPENLEKKAMHVRSTWAHRCTKLIFISSETNTSFPTVGIDVPEGRNHLTGKTMKAFRYIYEHHLNDADWFMKADDDTYVIMENLRYFLSTQNKDDPFIFGHHFRPFVKQGYLSGGAGYVLSKEALRRFGVGSNDSRKCRQDGGPEDVEFGKCMQKLGVKVGSSTDKLGRSRFHCFPPETHLLGSYPNWYSVYDANRGMQKGRESISDYAISFHYIPPLMMYDLEFYIYHLRPYGIQSGNQELNNNS